MTTSAQTDKIDDYFKAEIIKGRIPGLSVAVLRNGKVLTTGVRRLIKSESSEALRGLEVAE